MAPEFCPNCGAEVPEGAKACPECGSCEETGWSEGAGADRLGLPDEEFDYGEFVEREFGGGKPRARKRRWLWWATAMLVLALFLFGWVF